MNAIRHLALSSFVAFLFCARASAVQVEIQYQDPAGTGFFDNTTVTPVGGNTGTTLGAQRRIALEYALVRWGKNIQGSVPIRVKAVSLSTPRSSLTLASASPLVYFKDWAQGTPPPLANVAYPSALATEIAGVDFTDSKGSTFDIQINNVPAWDTPTAGDQRVWYYGLDSNPTVNPDNSKNIDFVGVMLHEICHGLGFVAGIANDGSYYYFGGPNIWDTFLTDDSGTALTGMSQSNRAAMLTSNNLFTGGSILRSHNDTSRAKVFAPNPIQPGSSTSHFDETTYSSSGSLNEMMTPVKSFGTQVFGSLVLDMLQDMGYQIADTQPPVVDITVPTSGRSFKSSPAPTFSGTATDTASAGNSNAAGMLWVKVALWGANQGKWYNWGSSNFDSGTFTYANHTKIVTLDNLPLAVGARAWSFAAPSGLPDGNYQLAVTAVDQVNQGSEFIYNNFTIDTAAAPVQITPFADNAQVFDLSPMRFVSQGAQSVTFQITKDPGGLDTSWNGSAWVSGPAPVLATTQISTGLFKPSGTLPGRADWPLGSPLAITATSVDAANNVSTKMIVLTRTAADTTVPDLTLSMADGTVLTQAVLPAINGTANDPESGIKSVTFLLTRSVPGGNPLYWGGFTWNTTPTQLPLAYDSWNHVWSAPYYWASPSNTSLPNASYNLQITATNNESPAGTRNVGVNFIVDHHEVYTWTGATFRDSNPNNDSHAWETEDNWYPNGVPGVDDYAVIDNGDTVLVADSVSVYGLNLINGGLNFTNGPGALGTVTTSGKSKWKYAYLNGNWTNLAGATIDLLDGGFYLMSPGSKLDNSGIVNRLDGSGYFRDNGGPVTINNLAGGVFNLAGTTSPLQDYNGGNVFNNAGTFNRNVGPDIVHVQYWTFNNTGVIRADASTLQFDSTLNLNAGGSFAGTSAMRLNGTTNVNASITLPNNVTLTGGVINSTNSVAVSGDFTWLDGRIHGTLNIASGSLLTVTGPYLKLMDPGAVLNNSGTLRWLGQGSYFRDNGGGVTINNLASGTFDLASEGSPFENYNGGNVFNNAGTLMHSMGTAATFVHLWTFNNTGLIRADAAASVLTFDSPLNLNAGSSFAGTTEIDLNGTTTVNAPVTLPTTIRLTGGVMACTAAAPISGNFTWINGRIAGTMNLTHGSSLDVTGPYLKALDPGAVLNNSGTVRWLGQGSYFRDNGGNVTINNLADGIFDVASDGSPFENFSGTNVLNNAGLFKRSAGSNPVSIHAWTFTNSGTILCDASTLQFDSVLNLNAGTTFAGTSPIKLNGTTNASAGTTLSLVSLTGGTLNCPGGVGIAGDVQWVDGSLNGQLNIPSGANLTLDGTQLKLMQPGSVINNSGTVNCGPCSLRDNGGGVTFNNLAGATFNLKTDGIPLDNYSGGNVFNNAGSFVKDGGIGNSNVHAWVFKNSGKLVATTGNLVFDGQEVDLNAGGSILGTKLVRFTSGQAYLRGTTTCSGGHPILDGANLNGHADGTGTLAGGPWLWNSGPMAGNVKIASSATVSLAGSGFRWMNTDAVLDNFGAISFTDNGSLQGTGNDRIHNQAGGVFSVAGSVGFSNYFGGNAFINDGVVSIGPALSQWSLPWAFTQTATGSLNIDVSGPSPAEFDRFSINGTATLAGAVNVTKLNGYTPAQGTTFPFLTANSVTGTFALVDGGFSCDYTSNSATLKVTSKLTFDSWMTNTGLTGNDALRSADPDHDGLTNFAEYVFNTNPAAGNLPPLSTDTTVIGDQRWLVLSYRSWTDREAAGVVYSPQSSVGLGSWSGAGVVNENDWAAPAIPGSNAFRCRIPVGPAAGFLRVAAMQP